MDRVGGRGWHVFVFCVLGGSLFDCKEGIILALFLFAIAVPLHPFVPFWGPTIDNIQQQSAEHRSLDSLSKPVLREKD